MMTLKKCLLFAISLCCCLILWPRSGQAIVSFQGQFVAQQACPAYQSIKNQTNPGNIRLTPQATYSVVGKNKAQASYYLLQIPGASPPTRWVSVQCGQLAGASASNPSAPSNANSAQSNQDYLLALSWQPSFCETKPDKTECKTQTAQRFDATNLVLHGLWPQPSQNIYCNVSQNLIQLDKKSQWFKLPPINLSQKTRNALATKMPGYASGLYLHEWYKHGTCYGGSPEEYFQEAIALLDQVNNSAVRTFFASNIGKFVSANQIRDQFDKAFKSGAGKRVQVQCQRDINEDRNNMVVELQINLKGTIQPNTSIVTLLQGGKVVPAGCSSGEIDPAGFNS